MPAAARHRGCHRKPRGARREHGFRTRSGGAAARPVRPIAATAGVALVGASVIAVTPVAPPPPEIRVASPEVRLAAASSLLNVPVNLLIDLVNIPYNEVQAINYTGKSLIYSGPWFVVGATNIWGVDPGDPGHFMSIVNMAVPFPALSGMALGEFDQNGLGQQLWYFVAAQLPVSQYCDDDGCLPTTRMSPITGITAVDYLLWNVAIFSGQVKFPLFNNFFKVPLSDLTSGYTFGPDYPGYADPAGPVYDGLGFKGTTVDPRRRKRNAVGRHDIYVGSVQALPKLLRPFNGRSVNEPNPASRPRAIRQSPSNSRRGAGHCLRPNYTGVRLLPGGLQLFACRSGLSRDRENYRRRLAGK